MSHSRDETGYALGHSEREMRRLGMQARIFEPFTLQMLRRAGVGKGMRILDVGSGAGDVTLLCASLVGFQGEVIGIDRSPQAVEAARERVRTAGIENVTFILGDPSEMQLDGTFDAVVGRLVLMHQPDPAAMLRKLARTLRPDGIIAFQDFDIGGARSAPPSPTYDQCVRWIEEVFAVAGADNRMGMKLYPTFRAAGLPAPSMSIDGGIWGGPDNPAAIMVSEVMRTLLPLLLKSGIATEEQVGIDSLRERVDQEIVNGGGVVTSPSLIGAWTRVGSET
jgi:SAM-dependent methyltransferase